MATKYNTNSKYWYGLRHNSDEPKASGYFGEVDIPKKGKATEYSVDVEIDGKNVQIPTLVPTLSSKEFNAVKRSIASEGKEDIPESVMDKAVEHAKERISKGKSPFWAMPEKQVPQPTEKQEKYAKGGIVVNKGVGASMKPHNVFGNKGK